MKAWQCLVPSSLLPTRQEHRCVGCSVVTSCACTVLFQVQHNAEVLGTRPRYRMRSRDDDDGEDDDAALWDVMILDEVCATMLLLLNLTSIGKSEGISWMGSRGDLRSVCL